MCCGTHVSNLSHLQVHPPSLPLSLPSHLPLTHFFSVSLPLSLCSLSPPISPSLHLLLSLQCVKLLHTESKRGSTLLYYIAGRRVLHYLDKAYSNERSLNKLLRLIYVPLLGLDIMLLSDSLYSVTMEEHKEAVERLMKSSKQAAKVTRSQLREIAQLLAQLHLNSPSPPSLVCIHMWSCDNHMTQSCDIM